MYFITENVYDHYLFLEELGRGGFSIVKRACHMESGELVAIKIISKSNLTELQLEHLKEEISIMRMVESCPQIISLLDAYEDNENVYLVIELIDGGNLLETVLSRSPSECLDECDMARIMRSILLAVAYCHARGVVHRDMKPDNLLVSKDCTSVKLSDFGLATFLSSSSIPSGTVGTRAYLPPEMILKTPYSFAVDMWSIGCIAYVLLSGYHPFSEDTDTPLYIQIVTGQWEFHQGVWDYISDDAKDFISELLVLDPEERMTAREALRHPWIRAVGPSPPISPRLDLDLAPTIP